MDLWRQTYCGQRLYWSHKSLTQLNYLRPNFSIIFLNQGCPRHTIIILSFRLPSTL